MSITADLTAALQTAFAAVAPLSQVQVNLRPSALDGYDFQTDAAFKTSASGTVPLEVASKAAEAFAACRLVSSAAASGRGFLNVRLSKDALSAALAEMACSSALGLEDTGKGRTAVLDYGGPNISKRLHAGHLRSFVIGESLRRILCATGWNTVSDIHLGDWGLPMGMLIDQARLEWPDGLPNDLEIGNVERLYLRGAAACKANPDALDSARRTTAALHAGEPHTLSLWRTIKSASLQSVDKAASLLGAKFDLMLGESDAQPWTAFLIEDLQSKGLACQEEGAIVCPGVPQGCPPLVLVKADGAVTYAATDIATLRYRTSGLGACRVVYCVDSRQSLHFQSVFAVARAAGYADGVELEHAGFGTVNGPDGKPFRTREGGVPTLESLVELAVAAARERKEGDQEEQAAFAIGLAAIKFADLSGDRETGYAFDPRRMAAAEGRTGPYLQYAAVRMKSILAKAAAAGLAPSEPFAAEDGAERELALECLTWPDAVASASTALQPGIVAGKAWRIAQAFSRFYAESPVIGGGEAAPRRLALCTLSLRVTERSMDLLGIEPLRSM